jgi:hypothetical protein
LTVGDEGLDRLWFRSAAICCAFAWCALAAGPGFAGVAVAHADLFGIDFFGDDDKSDLHHPRPGSEDSAQSTRAATGIAAAEAPTARVGSTPGHGGVSETAAVVSPGSVPEAAVTAAGGGGGTPRTNATGRPANLPRVSSAPATRSVVIRRVPRRVSAGPAEAAQALPRSPVVALAAPPPEFAEPEVRPAPAGPPAAASTAPRAKDPLAPGGSGTARAPESYRAGYAEYLRSADTAELLVAALPGAAGIAGFTLVGAYAGYRQARALQKALLAPAPTSIRL